MAVLFVVCLIFSNLFAIKIIQVAGVNLPGGVIIFPIAYILNDCFTEVWGYKKARLVIWIAFAMNFFVAIFGQIVVWLPSAPFWDNAEKFDYIFNLAPKVVIASFLAFIAGSTMNAYVLSKMKIASQGRNFSLRAVASSFAGEFLDSLIFIPIVFLGQMPLNTMIVMIFTQVMIKVVYEIIILPFTILVVNKIKAYEGENVFDKNISYNPFNISDF